MSLERLWAGWRSAYMASAGQDIPVADACVFCTILALPDPPEVTYVVWRDADAAVLLNAYPYTAGHLLVTPVRHVAELDELGEYEGERLWWALRAAEKALHRAYRPEGTNLGANLGRAAGAGIPEHLHFHALPRWSADTNFMTTVAETRVLPEALSETFARVRAAFGPSPTDRGTALA